MRLLSFFVNFKNINITFNIRAKKKNFNRYIIYETYLLNETKII